MRLHATHRHALAVATAGILLAACGSSASTPDASDDGTGANGTCLAGSTDCADDPSGGAPPSMGMCAPGVTDCVDTVVEQDAGEESGDASGDRLMSADITIVEAFVDPDTRSVEMAPGSVAEPFAIFLQEAVVDGLHVNVSFSGGETPCFVVDHVEVDERDDEVVVRVMVGQPDPDAQDCDQQQISMQSVGFDLTAELGDRPLVDGSRTAPAGDNV